MIRTLQLMWTLMAFEVMFRVKYYQLGFCCASTWACALYAPAATVVEAAKSSARRAQPLRTSAAAPLVKQTAAAGSCSVAHRGMHSPGRCPSGGRRGPAPCCAPSGTDARGHYTPCETHSAASSAVSLRTSRRYLLRADSAGLPRCWTGSFLRQRHTAPELQLHDQSKTRGWRTEKLDTLLLREVVLFCFFFEMGWIQVQGYSRSAERNSSVD